MEADRKLVRRIARLASLGLSEEEEIEFAEDLKLIMDYMERLAEIDTGDMEPMEHVLPLKNVLRPDIPEDCKERDELLKCAACMKDGCYVVPSVVDSL